MKAGTARKRVVETPAYDVRRLRKEFPALAQKVHGHPLVYLDNAATTQKPRAVLEAIRTFYEEDCSNIHRGLHQLSERATKKFEEARTAVRKFIGAADPGETIFVRGTTEAINLVAHSFVRRRLKPGDEVLITAMEHHSNIVPWQIVCEETGAKLKVAPIDDRGELILEQFEALLGPRTRFVSAVHASNALGTVNPVKTIIDLAHAKGVPVLVDGAQAAAHRPVDVRALGCDFYAFSGHKLYGPTGIGILYGRRELLEAMPPYQSGGDMIRSVTFEKTTYNVLPHKFEAGTPHVAGGIGLGAAVRYLEGVGLDGIAAHEHALLEYGTKALEKVPGLRLVGTAREKSGVLSFVIEGIHPHDIGTILDRQGIAIRTGHHCAQPIMDRFGVPATARASLGLYNTREELDLLVGGLQEAIRVLR